MRKEKQREKKMRIAVLRHRPNGDISYDGIMTAMPDFADVTERTPITNSADAPYPTGYLVANAMRDGLKIEVITCSSTTQGKPHQRFIAIKP